MAVLSNTMMQGTAAISDDAGDYQIPKSLKFKEADSTNLTLFTSAGNRRAWTWAAWIKRWDVDNRSTLFSAGDSQSDDGWTAIEIETDEKLKVTGWNTTWKQTSRLFRDPAAWTHIVISFDTMHNANSDRCRMYVNGKRQTSFSAENAPTQNTDYAVNKGGVPHRIGGIDPAGVNNGLNNFYLADNYLIDGVQLSPACFGFFDSTGVWQAKAFAPPTPNTDAGSPTWSGDLVHLVEGFNSNNPATKPFSGYSSNNGPYTSTMAGGPNNTGGYFSGETKAIEFTPTDPIPFNCSIEVRGRMTNQTTSRARLDFGDGYGSIIEIPNGYWNTIHEGKGSLKKLKFWTITYAGENEIGGIRIDGVDLVDGRVDRTPLANPNTGTTWSSDCTLTNTTRASTNLFDGLTANSAAGVIQDNSSNTAKVTFNTTIKCGLVEVWSDSGTNVIGINTETPDQTVSHAGWHTIYDGAETTLSKITWKMGGSNIGRIDAIKVDGYLLYDSRSDNSFHLKFNDTTKNRYLGKDTLHGKIDDATGGLPIYNTTDLYGDVKGSGNRADSSAGTTDGAGLVLAIPGDTFTDYASFADEHVDDAATAFDGSLTGTYATAGGGTTGTFTFTGSKFTGITKLRIYGKYDSRDNAADSKILVNDEDIQVGSSAAWVTATEHLDSGTLNTIKIVSDSYNTALYAIEIDDVVVQTGDDLDIHASINTGSSNKTFTNSSVTAATDQSRLYGSSLKSTGTQYGSFAHSDDFHFGSGNFTVECWAYCTNDSIDTSDGIIANWDSSGNDRSWMLCQTENEKFGFMWSTNGSSGTLLEADNKSINNWHHIAAVRNSNTISLYIDGILNASASESGTLHDNDGAVFLGKEAQSSWGTFEGYINDLRVYKGVAKYTANFTAPNRNDFTVNNLQTVGASGTMYSSAGTWAYSPSGPTTAGSEKNAFDGDSTTSVSHALAGDGYVEYTFPSAVTVSSKLEVDYYNPDGYNITTYYKINSEAERSSESPSGNNHFYSELKNSSGGTWTGSLTKIRLRLTRSGANSHANLYGIKVDGNVILDGTSDAGKDILTDSPTNYGTDEQNGGEVRGNYCTLNPLAKGSNSSLSNGNLDYSSAGGSDDCCLPTMFMKTGKWYAEVTQGSKAKMNIGLAATDQDITKYVGQAGYQSYSYYSGNGNFYNGPGSSNAAYGNSWDTEGDVVGIAFDADNGTIWFHKNGTWQASATKAEIAAGTTTNAAKTGISMTKAWGICAGANDMAGSFNYGQRAWKYPNSVPDGFKAVCTQNFDNLFDSEASENDPSKYFDTKTWTGTGASQAIKGYGFSPDFVWIKQRNGTGNHSSHDVINGVTKGLHIDHNAALFTDASTLTAFNSDGFTLGGHGITNGNTNTYVGWAWDAGTSFSNSSGTNGASVASSGSYNATAGFAIVEYTGGGYAADTGVYHPLAAVPNLIIHKRTDGTSNWEVYTTEVDGSYDQLTLNTSDAKADSSQTAPTNTLFNSTWSSNQESITYLWTAIPGYSAFGKYIGNGNADGPFVYTGFKPKWILTKETSGTGGWKIWDTERNTTNPNNNPLWANITNDESGANVGYQHDLLSNGFRVRATTGHAANDDGDTYIYAAFAEHPFKTARAR